MKWRAATVTTNVVTPTKTTAPAHGRGRLLRFGASQLLIRMKSAPIASTSFRVTQHHVTPHRVTLLLDIAVELDRLRARVARAVSEGDLAGRVQNDLLPPQPHFRPADGEIGAIAALIHQHKMIRPPLDLRVAPRSHRVRDHDGVVRVAPEGR